MEIIANGLSKSYDNSFIFTDLDLHVQTGDRLAILGPNGSGKSTLIKCLMGFSELTRGQLCYKMPSGEQITDGYFRYVVGVAPYMHFEDMMTVEDMLAFFFGFRNVAGRIGLSSDALLAYYDFEQHRRKKIHELSSGLLQRFRLILALSAECECLFLDEPCTNLDDQGIAWYRNLISELPVDLTIIVASNRREEYDFCTRELHILDCA